MSYSNGLAAFKCRALRSFVLQCACCGLAFGFPAIARSAPKDNKEECLQAYTAGQRARNAGALVEAKRAFVFCGGASCPSALHGDCLRWLDEVEAATPTAVFQVVNPAGERLSGARVRVDSGSARELDGRALPFDPGQHVLTFELDGYKRLEQRFAITDGEKLVAVKVTLVPASEGHTSDSVAADAVAADAVAADAVAGDQGAAPSIPAERGDGTTSLPIWIGAGIGALGVAGFSYFGLSARSDDEALGNCYPACPVERVDEVERGYRNAHISLGVGAVGVLVAVAWWVFSSGDSEAANAASGPALSWSSGTTPGLVGRF